MLRCTDRRTSIAAPIAAALASSAPACALELFSFSLAVLDSRAPQCTVPNALCPSVATDTLADELVRRDGACSSLWIAVQSGEDAACLLEQSRSMVSSARPAADTLLHVHCCSTCSYIDNVTFKSVEVVLHALLADLQLGHATSTWRTCTGVGSQTSEALS